LDFHGTLHGGLSAICLSLLLTDRPAVSFHFCQFYQMPGSKQAQQIAFATFSICRRRTPDADNGAIARSLSYEFGTAFQNPETASEKNSGVSPTAPSFHDSILCSFLGGQLN